MQRKRKNILSKYFYKKNLFFIFQITAPVVDTWEPRLKTEMEKDLKEICKFTFTETVDNAKFADIFLKK